MGSTFTLYLPLTSRPPRRQASSSARAIAPMAAPDATLIRAAHRRHGLVGLGGRPPAIHPGDRVVLIVEDDERFASVLLELAREQGFKGLIATDGAAGWHSPIASSRTRSPSISACPIWTAGHCSTC